MRVGIVALWCIGLGAASAVVGLQYASYERQVEAAHKADQAMNLVAQLADRPPPVPLAAFGPHGPSADEIRSIVREELKTGVPGAQSPREAQPLGEAPPEPPGPSQASLVALTDATRVVDSAIVSGRWDEADVNAVREVRTEMSGEQMESVARRLAKAVNEQKVKIAVAGPLF